MEIIGAAALIAVGIVVAAMVYGRTHGMHAQAVRPPERAEARPPERAAERGMEVAAREADLARREAELARREAELEGERQSLVAGHGDLERELERVSGLSAARA